jgi:hypothetical protein
MGNTRGARDRLPDGHVAKLEGHPRVFSAWLDPHISGIGKVIATGGDDRSHVLFEGHHGRTSW